MKVKRSPGPQQSITHPKMRLQANLAPARCLIQPSNRAIFVLLVDHPIDTMKATLPLYKHSQDVVPSKDCHKGKPTNPVLISQRGSQTQQAGIRLSISGLHRNAQSDPVSAFLNPSETHTVSTCRRCYNTGNYLLLCRERALTFSFDH